MTNFELNKKLAELLGLEVQIVSFPNYKTVFLNHGTIAFNPCTNWNDIMPIAIKLGEVSVRDFSDSKTFHEAYIKVTADYEGFWEYDAVAQVALVKCCIAVLESNKNKGE